MADVYPIDYESDVGRVRKYIPDVRQFENEYIFTDAEIQSFIDDQTYDGVLPTTVVHILRAAAWAMIAIGNDENLILKKLVTEDLETDGPAVQKQMLAAAAMLFKRADDAEIALGEVEDFLIVPHPYYQSDYEVGRVSYYAF